MSVSKTIAQNNGLAKIVKKSLNIGSMKITLRNRKIHNFVVNVKKMENKPQLNA